MVSTTENHPAARGDEALLAERKEKLGIDTEGKMRAREAYLDPDYPVADGADAWEKSGKARVFRGIDEAWKAEDGKLRGPM